MLPRPARHLLAALAILVAMVAVACMDGVSSGFSGSPPSFGGGAGAAGVPGGAGGVGGAPRPPGVTPPGCTELRPATSLGFDIVGGFCATDPALPEGTTPAEVRVNVGFESVARLSSPECNDARPGFLVVEGHVVLCGFPCELLHERLVNACVGPPPVDEDAGMEFDDEDAGVVGRPPIGT